MTIRILHTFVLLLGLTVLVGACASVPPPEQELEVATAALQTARTQGAPEHAADQFRLAEQKLANAKQLIEQAQNTAARRELQQAAVDAKLAAAMAEFEQRDAEQRALQAQISELQQRIEGLQ